MTEQLIRTDGADLFEPAGEVVSGELAALVRVENLGSTVTGESIVESRDAERGVHRVRQAP